MSRNPERSARDDVFVAEVLSSFGFLISDYGFRCVTATPTHVRYESKHVFVNVYRDPVSFEIEVEIGRRHLIRAAERGFTLGEIMDSLSAREKEGYTFIQASTSERVRKFVPIMAEWTKRYASETLSGSRSSFLRALVSRERRADHEWEQMELSTVRARADRAWHRKDYRQIVELYSAVAPGDLTASEVKKLEYAKKRLGG